MADRMEEVGGHKNLRRPRGRLQTEMPLQNEHCLAASIDNEDKLAA